jgi:heme/copper-type cytochrome/quinol oxidase subunit 2
LDAKPQEVHITVIAFSLESALHGENIEERAGLLVKIIAKEKPVEEKPWFYNIEFQIILLMIIIIFIVLIIVLVYRKSKKKSEEVKEEPAAEEALTVKPGIIQPAVIAIGEPPPQTTLPKVEKIASSTPTPQLAQIGQEVPALAPASGSTSTSGTVPGQVPEGSQTAQTIQVPQLPPKGADNNIKPES